MGDDAAPARERVIADGLRRVYDLHKAGDLAGSSALLGELRGEFGEPELYRVKLAMNRDQTRAELGLAALFGPTALYGDE